MSVSMYLEGTLSTFLDCNTNDGRGSAHVEQRLVGYNEPAGGLVVKYDVLAQWAKGGTCKGDMCIDWQELQDS